MTNALATLNQASADAHAARLLSEHASSCLTVTTTATGEWILSPANNLTAAKLREGVSALHRALTGGPTARIAASLMRLISATRRPSWMDDETAAVYFDTLQEALHDYPIDCVEEACIQWRKGKNGEWWPAEAELRRVCERLFGPRRDLHSKALQLLQHLEDEENRAERARKPSYFAGDRHKAFRAEMEKLLLRDQVRAYFAPSQIRYIGENAIHVRTQVAESIFTRYGASVLRELGLKISHVPADFERERELSGEPSHEENEEVTRRMVRLNKAMSAGENIEALRRSGEL